MNILQKLYTLSKTTKLILGLILTIILSIICLRIGSVSISIPDIAKSIFTGEILSKESQIILYVRIPRILSAILVGAALAVSGGILQSILNNPIVSPGVIGVNAGSGLFSLIAIVFFSGNFFAMPIFAFVGALLASLLIFLIGYKTGASKQTIVLSGIAVTGFLSALSDTMITIFPDAQISRTSFLIGGLSSVTMKNIEYTYLYIIVGIIVALIFSYDLNVLELGDETAQSLGLKKNRIRFLYIVIAALLSASAVSIGGLIGFVGLIIPHISRFLIGNDNRFLLPMCAIIGAAFLLICDMLARTLFSPFEIPVGIILSLIGSPSFIYLLIKQKRGNADG